MVDHNQSLSYPPHVSSSRISLFKKCKYAHYIRYGLGIKRKQATKAPRIGKAFHAALHCIKSQEPERVQDTINDEYKENGLSDEIVDEKAFVAAVTACWQDQYRHDGLKYLLSEIETNVSIKGVPLKAVLDGFVRDENGDFWIVEHKLLSRWEPRDWNRVFLTSSVNYMSVRSGKHTANCGG